MRNSNLLSSLFAATRAGILEITLMQPDRWWYLSELASGLETAPSSLQRELEKLVRIGVLEQRKEGRRIYVRAAKGSPIYPELRALVGKTVGVHPQLKRWLSPYLDSIRCAFIYGSVARGEESAQSDVDVMVVGALPIGAFSSPLRRLEKKLGREVNVTLFSAGELAKRAKGKDHFVSEVLRAKKIFLKGTEDGLASIARGR